MENGEKNSNPKQADDPESEMPILNAPETDYAHHDPFGADSNHMDDSDSPFEVYWIFRHHPADIYLWKSVGATVA
ncbi:hypothetical protein AYI68_g2233 [Smittium mucronatum]|uniref:Uncharacterized protein n=1 Tax=Smittium mucronatum TaxID=133383 RepID=A0A1R0H3C0_9FUNG|nr:hypothetical protein AYI68_g2233 [Smittium mucronatum]